MGAAPSAGLLSVVGTPIGNLSDASPRVTQTLSQADVILCEDTRVTSKLLAHFGIHVPLRRADENVLAERVDEVLERLAAGERVAFVSDAGMPGVSDPGQKLVDAALEAGQRVEVIPGPSAVTCALVASGLPMEHFFFEGFLPRKRTAMLERLRELAPIPGALVIYESPRRVEATLERIAEVFPERQVALLRELTKLHEECVRGNSSELAERISARIAEKGELKGECVLVIAGPSNDELASLTREAEALPTLDEAIEQGLREGEPASKLAKRLAKTYGIARAELYDRIVAAR